MIIKSYDHWWMEILIGIINSQVNDNAVSAGRKAQPTKAQNTPTEWD